MPIITCKVEGLPLFLMIVQICLGSKAIFIKRIELKCCFPVKSPKREGCIVNMVTSTKCHLIRE